MEFTGRTDSLGLHILLGILLSNVFQGAAKLVCPEIGFLDSPAKLSCIGTGRTHSYGEPSGGVVTTCDMNTSKCLPDAMVTIPNSSYSVLTLPRVNQLHAGKWTCSIGDSVSWCLMAVASVAEIVCPEIGFLDSPAKLSCIGTGRTHSYRQPSGGIVTTCDMNTSKCLPDAMVTIPNSSYSVLTLPRVNQSHAGNWTCSIGDYESHCLMTVASAAELVCPEIGFLDSPANLSCIGTGRTHSYGQPSGGIVTTCLLNTSKCLPDAMVTIPNSSYSVLTLPRVKQSHAGKWACYIGNSVSRCLMTVAKLPSCDILSSRTAEEVTVRVQDYHCSDSIELYLKAGHLTGRLLNVQRTATPVGMFEITVNVATSLAETKKLVFVCGNTSWDIACQEQVTADSRRGGSITSAVVVGAVVAGSVAVTIIFVLVVVLVKMKQSKRTQKPETHSDRNVYDSPNDVDGQTDDTAGHEYTTLNRTPIEGGSIYNVIST